MDDGRRTFTIAIPGVPDQKTPTIAHPTPRPKPMHFKRVTLTSKKNWWMGTLTLYVSSVTQPMYTKPS